MRCNVDKSNTGFDGQKYQSISQLIKNAYGLSANQIRQQMEWAELKAQSEPFLEEASIPEPSQQEFSTILAKMAARGITPRLLADFDPETQKAMAQESYLDKEQFPHQINTEADYGGKTIGKAIKETIESVEIFLRKPLRTAGIAAACLAIATMIFLAPKINAIAKKRYQYEARVESGERGRIVWNNQEDYISDVGNLEKAYKQIREELGIPVLKLNYIPEGMYLSNLEIKDRQVRMEFIYSNNSIYMFEVSYPVTDSGAHYSDCEEYKNVYNEWIGQDIPVRRNKRQKRDYEYNAYFSSDNSYYILAGVVIEEEFINIVKNLVIEE